MATMYMNREVKALGLRKCENYQKDAVEGIFEYVRETEFPKETSRLRCVYYCESEKEALDYAQDDCIAAVCVQEDASVHLCYIVQYAALRRTKASLVQREAFSEAQWPALLCIPRNGRRPSQPMPSVW